jgi:hypothetical protein
MAILPCQKAASSGQARIFLAFPACLCENHPAVRIFDAAMFINQRRMIF